MKRERARATERFERTLWRPTKKMHQGSPESEKLKASLLKFYQLLKINFGLRDEEEDRPVMQRAALQSKFKRATSRRTSHSFASSSSSSLLADECTHNGDPRRNGDYDEDDDDGDAIGGECCCCWLTRSGTIHEARLHGEGRGCWPKSRHSE